MSKSALCAWSAAVVLVVGAAIIEPIQAQQLPAPDISQPLRETFRAAQAAQKAQKWSEVITRAQQVLAGNQRKVDDTYYAYYLLFDAYRALGDKDGQLTSLQGLVNSGFLNTDQVAPYVSGVMKLAFQAKDYDTAIEYGTRLIRSGHADPQVFTTIGQSHYLKADYAESARFFRSLIDEQIKRGQKPLEQNLVMMHSSYDKLGDREGATYALELLVVHYPKAEYWDALLYTIRTDSELQQREKLQVYRLMAATGTLKLRQDFSRYVELAELVGLPAEAAKVYEAGLAANVFVTESENLNAERRMTAVLKAAEADKAGLAKQEAAAATAASGEEAVALGMAYYSYGQADQAIAALEKGLSKGGLSEGLRVEASLMLGMAQLQAKDRAAALRTFKGIETSNPRLQRIANLWALKAS